MSKYDFAKLQNGSDIRGIALEGVEGEAVNLTDDAVERLSRGFLFWLANETGKNVGDMIISVGRDPRLSGENIANIFMKTIASQGCNVLDAGLASTPAMFMSSVFEEYNCDGAVMVTASHLPWNRNGLKFFSKRGGLEKGDITDIITFAESDSVLNSLRPSAPTEPKSISLMDTYAEHLKALIISGVDEGDKPLQGLKICVDAGNGSGGFYASKVLEPLGADVSTSQFLEPDGNFPNHAPNPEDKAAMKSICDKVAKSHVDLGLIFDTDVDRSSAVDESGKEINRNAIVAMAAALVAIDYPGTTVVTDSVTSNQLTDYLENCLGLKHLRFKRGYRNVINKAIELNESGVDSQLAIETSGHGAFKENYFLDDGAYLATKIVIKTAKLKKTGAAISAVLASLEHPAEAEEVRFPIKCEDFGPYGDAVLSELTALFGSQQVKGASLVSPNYEGIRINFDLPDVKGWCLLRKSLHDPIMPLNIESDTPGGCAVIRRILKPLLSGYCDLDISRL